MLRMSISLGGRDYAKKGQPVVIELTSLDVPTGFNAPNFHACTGIVPGAVSRVSFTPNRTGEFTFLCNAFCRA
jgi:cytochrome c oxidase subunit II